MRNFIRGITNLWKFLPVVWRWRGWDYVYTYELFVRGLELQAEHIGKHQNHTDWKKCSKEIREAVGYWRVFTGLDAQPELKDNAWRLFHNLIKRRGMAWWD